MRVSSLFCNKSATQSSSTSASDGTSVNGAPIDAADILSSQIVGVFPGQIGDCPPPKTGQDWNVVDSAHFAVMQTGAGAVSGVGPTLKVLDTL